MALNRYEWRPKLKIHNCVYNWKVKNDVIQASKNDGVFDGKSNLVNEHTPYEKKETNKNLDAHYIAMHKCHYPGSLFVSIRGRLENSMANITTIRNHSNSREQMDKNWRNNNNEEKEEFKQEMLNAQFLVLSLSCTKHELLELCCEFFTNINWCE